MNRLAIILASLLCCLSLAPAQKQLPPEGGKPKDFKLPQKNTFALPNGVKAVLVKYGTVPKVSVSVVVRSGMLNETADEVWLGDLMGEMLKEGTATRSAQEISRAAALMGGGVNVSVGADQTTVSGDVLSESGADMLRLLADIVRNPRFPASELARLRNDKIRALNLAKADPQQMTNEKFRKLMFPDHPYGRLYPTEEALRGYTIEQVRKFHEANFSAARTTIFVVGRFDQPAMEQSIREAFSGWKKGAPPLLNVPAPVSRREIHIIDRPGAAQSTVYLGLPVPDPSSKEYMPLKVTDALLGGSFASRITENIREDKGYTYSPFSVVSARYRNAYWVEQADVTTDVTGPSLKEIFHEIERLQSTAPPEEELKGIQNYLAGIFVLQNSSRGGITNQLSFLNLHRLPDSYLTGYVKAVYAVNPATVQRVAKTLLRPEEMRIVIAGDKKKIQEQVAGFGQIAD